MCVFWPSNLCATRFKEVSNSVKASHLFLKKETRCVLPVGALLRKAVGPERITERCLGGDGSGSGDWGPIVWVSGSSLSSPIASFLSSRDSCVLPQNSLLTLFKHQTVCPFLPFSSRRLSITLKQSYPPPLSLKGTTPESAAVTRLSFPPLLSSCLPLSIYLISFLTLSLLFFSHPFCCTIILLFFFNIK